MKLKASQPHLSLSQLMCREKGFHFVTVNPRVLRALRPWREGNLEKVVVKIQSDRSHWRVQSDRLVIAHLLEFWEPIISRFVTVDAARECCN